MLGISKFAPHRYFSDAALQAALSGQDFLLIGQDFFLVRYDLIQFVLIGLNRRLIGQNLLLVFLNQRLVFQNLLLVGDNLIVGHACTSLKKILRSLIVAIFAVGFKICDVAKLKR